MASLKVIQLFAFLAMYVMMISSGVAAVEIDKNDNCQQWAEMGECENNPGFMLPNCATSCKRMEEAALKDAADLAGISSFYDLKAKDIKGNMIKFESLRGKVVIIVNVASYCGYTESHYRGLVDLWSKVKDKDVEILAFPCNQFGAQEPATDSEIADFAKMKGVEFTMMSKINVNGPNASLVYKYLKKEAGPASITWNFATYFVVSPGGTITSHSGVEPMGLFQYSMDLLNDEL